LVVSHGQWQADVTPAAPFMRELDAAAAWQSLMRGGWVLHQHSGPSELRTLVVGAAQGAGLHGECRKNHVIGARDLRLASGRARGTSYKVLGAELGRTAACARARVEDAMRKLGLASERELVELFLAWPQDVVRGTLLDLEPARLIVWYRTPPWVLPGCLSAAEKEVVKGLLAGGSHREVARQRAISRRTVANHVASVHRKLHVTSRIELFIALHGLQGNPARPTSV
jgi:DNA-binding NarL/FixJ family response regulator